MYRVIFLSYGQKLKTRCFSRMYLKTSALLSHLSRPTPIPDTPHQEDVSIIIITTEKFES